MLTTVLSSDADLARIRGTGSYRAALWVARFNFLPMIAWFGMMIGWRSAPGALIFGVWLTLVAGVLCVLLLFRHAGGRSLDQSRALRLAWQFYRDVLWPRRR